LTVHFMASERIS